MEKKNNLNIKPIDLKIVPTALEKSKKVMVSCEINGKITHYYIFIDKKAEYKDEDYIREAKKQLDDDIKNGVIKKKVATTTFKHPFVLATLGVVGAIALTMTGLFTWKALTATGGGGDVPPGPVPPEPTPTDDGDPTKPLTFVSLDDNGGVYFQYERYDDASAPIPDREEISLEYQIDDEETWHTVEGVYQATEDIEYTVPIVEGLKKGQEVRLRGDNPYWSYIDSDEWNSGEELSLITNGVFSIENNIMSLLHKENFVGATDLRCGEFVDLFVNDDPLSSKYDNYIYDASKLILPKVEELPVYCYEMMFAHTTLTLAPKEIIFKKSGYSACEDMFEYCENLIVGPKQIGDIDCEFGELCCSEMFLSCKKLKYGPYLPAISPGDSCYSWMFSGCESLIELKVGFEATAWQDNEFSDKWFGATGSIPLSHGLTPKFYLKGEQEPSERSISNIPQGWEIVHY